MPLTTTEQDRVTFDNPPGAHLYADQAGGAPPGTATQPGAAPTPPGPGQAGYLIAAAPSASALSRRSKANRPWTQRGRAQYIGLPIVTAALGAQDAVTEASYFNTPKNDPRQAGIDLSLSGTWQGTVSLQRCFNADCHNDAGSAVTEVWQTVETFTSNVEKVIQHFNPSAKLRLKMTSYSSGSCDARLSQA